MRNRAHWFSVEPRSSELPWEHAQPDTAVAMILGLAWVGFIVHLYSVCFVLRADESMPFHLITSWSL